MPARADAKALLRELHALDTRASNWKALWQELTEFMNPRKSQVNGRVAPGSKLTSVRLFDSTAPDAAYTLASSIHGSLSSSTSRWFTLEPDSEALRGNEEVLKWLERASDLLFSEFQSSNLDSEIQEAYLDLVTVATSAMLMEQEYNGERPGNFGGFRFQALPIGSYVIAVDPNGDVNKIFRCQYMTLESAAQKWPTTLSERARKRAESSPQDEIEVVHAVYRRPGVADRVPTSTARRRLPWASVWVERENQSILDESGYHEFCYAVARWSTQAGEVYGRGPGELALPDTRTLNEAVKLRLQAWQLAVAPPMKYRDRGVIGRVKWAPRAMNPVRDMDAIAPIETGSRFDVANFNEERLQMSIRGTFYNDKLQLPNKSIITATEAHQRIRMMHRVLGPALGRLDGELLRKIVNRGFSIMLRAGLFDPIPQALLTAAKNEVTNIRVRFVGPLARAQRVQEMEALTEFMNGVVPLVEVWPDIRDKINPDEYVDIAASATSVSRRVLNAPDQVVKLRKARAAAAAQENQRMAQVEAAKAAGAAAPAMKMAQEMQDPLAIAMSPPARNTL